MTRRSHRALTRGSSYAPRNAFQSATVPAEGRAMTPLVPLLRQLGDELRARPNMDCARREGYVEGSRLKVLPAALVTRRALVARTSARRRADAAPRAAALGQGRSDVGS